MEEDKIDFVLMWVDGNDPKWQAEKKQYDKNIGTNADNTIYRYRDWNLLQYWFRGVEKFAPWIRKIHFITWGHIPEWLDVNHPKINIVKHTDYIPEKYLPTFSANTIELNIHRIKDLSERFVLFNDDFYLIDTVKETDFFKGNIPVDTIGLNVHCPQKSLISQFFCLNDVSLINEHFSFKESFKKNWTKWFSLKNGKALFRTIVLMNCPRFPGFWQHHLASPFHKKTLEEVWEKEGDVLDNTCSHKFREITDVNQWLFKEWQIAQGNIAIRSFTFGKSFFIDRDGIKNTKDEILKYITSQKGKMIAINDGKMTDTEFADITQSLKNSFEKILPEKSSFEK